MKRIISLILILLLFTACVEQTARLVYLPEETENPSEQPTEAPTPELLEVAATVGTSFVTDKNGVPILKEQEHYFDYYVTFTDIRIYEYNDSTFLDAVAYNGYADPLSGAIRMEFKSADGTLYGYGDLKTADGDLILFPGENRIYAEIFTEIDVQQMDFVFAVTEPLLPVSE